MPVRASVSPALSSSLVPFNGHLICLQIYKAFKNDPVSPSAEGKRGGENEKEEVCPISFSSADKSNKHAGCISVMGQGMSGVCACMCVCVRCK